MLLRGLFVALAVAGLFVAKEILNRRAQRRIVAAQRPPMVRVQIPPTSPPTGPLTDADFMLIPEDMAYIFSADELRELGEAEADMRAFYGENGWPV